MSVALRRQRNGKLRPFWYGEYREPDGKRVVVNLGEWKGTPPPALLGTGTDTTGSAEFEKSRERAEKALKEQAEESRRKGRADHLIERLIEQKTGQAVDHVRIADLGARWVNMPRDGELTKAHKAGVLAAFDMFKRHMRKRNAEAAFLYQVTTDDAGTFATLLREAYSPSTAARYLVLMRSACKRFLPAGVANPFAGIVAKRSAKTGPAEIHRQPFTPEELRALIDAAEDDNTRDLITAAACTGMRRGDVCGLKWADVDLVAGMVTAKASKTGEPVEVPVFGPLRAVLDGRTGNGSLYVFPEAARMLRDNPDGLTWRFKKTVARAFGAAPEPPPERIDWPTVEAAGRRAIESRLPPGDRRDRMLDTLARYCAGQSVRQIETETGRPRSGVSLDLRTVEGWTGTRFMRAQAAGNVKATIAAVTRTERANGQRSASVRDWHALRTTFVTLALSAGVPLELVRRVTGHATVEIVLKHYFRPGREQFRAALTEALPAVLTGGDAAPVPTEGATLSARSERILARLGGRSEADRQRIIEKALAAMAKP